MDWLKAAYWDLREAVILLFGGTPISEDGVVSTNWEPDHDYAPEDEVSNLALRAIDAGELPFVGKRRQRRVAPAAFRNWAMSLGYEVPSGWQDLGGAVVDPTSAMPTGDSPDSDSRQHGDATQDLPAPTTKQSRGRPSGDGLIHHLEALETAACTEAKKLPDNRRKKAEVAKALHRQEAWRRWDSSTIDRQLKASWWRDPK